MRSTETNDPLTLRKIGIHSDSERHIALYWITVALLRWRSDRLSIPANSDQILRPTDGIWIKPVDKYEVSDEHSLSAQWEREKLHSGVLSIS